ncbi:hypothetical protein FA95DRAFT_1570362 [Auriscalpium vulgare]|uniref:Uncharacterized protein n=1 Tax=Auriscalpium vulgare TaxID=40419 RepID=A0ACB8S3E7_9AGAM|nr:hypothetical protein FA95DRAFT_1570362 [Auriscalpium vulgare]
MSGALLLLALAASARVSLLSDIRIRSRAERSHNHLKTLKLADDDVCAAEFNRFGPILAHSLGAFSMGRAASTKFCDAVFGLRQVVQRLTLPSSPCHRCQGLLLNQLSIVMLVDKLSSDKPVSALYALLPSVRPLSSRASLSLTR